LLTAVRDSIVLVTGGVVLPTERNTATLDLTKQRVLGIDPALRCTGFGVIDPVDRSLHAVDCGVVRTTPKQPMSECLRRLAGGIREIVQQYQPAAAAIEGGFFARNAKTAMVLGMARGVVVGTLADLGVTMYEYAPRRVKQSVCGYGNAGKEQVAQVVAQMLGLEVDDLPRDATDALALAICHLQTASNMQGLLVPDPL